MIFIILDLDKGIKALTKRNTKHYKRPFILERSIFSCILNTKKLSSVAKLVQTISKLLVFRLSKYIISGTTLKNGYIGTAALC